MWSVSILTLLYVADFCFLLVRCCFKKKIWMAADMIGPLMDSYECLLWQENCCTIFLYWWWASSSLGWPGVSESCHKQWLKPLVYEPLPLGKYRQRRVDSLWVCVDARLASLLVNHLENEIECCTNWSRLTKLKDCCLLDHVIFWCFVCF